MNPDIASIYSPSDCMLHLQKGEKVAWCQNGQFKGSGNLSIPTFDWLKISRFKTRKSNRNFSDLFFDFETKTKKGIHSLTDIHKLFKVGQGF